MAATAEAHLGGGRVLQLLWVLLLSGASMEGDGGAAVRAASANSLVSTIM